MQFSKVKPLIFRVFFRKPGRHFSALRVFALVGLMSLSACAYRAGYGDRQIPGGYHAIAVPVFKNQSRETGAEVYFTNAIIRELERSRIGVVTTKENSQVTLEGIVDSIVFDNGNAFDAGPGSSVLGTTVRTIATVTLRLRRNSDQRVLWENAFTKESNYTPPKILKIQELTAANALYNQSARYQNIELIAADMMVEAHDRLTENF